MSNDLGQLTEKRKRWVEANRENGFEDGIKRLLTELYPDNAHFIYELLQNAEDARDKENPNSCGASVVRFTLNEDSLEFEHDGESLFNLTNVDSITGIGVSTKRDDPTSIGKFGVGFKAVFAYTNTPEIHSGDYHFRICDLVVPEPVEPCKMGERETKFIFPFNHPKKLPKQAETEIAKGLCDLGDNTLLFLKHIRKIEFLLPDGSLGYQERVEHDNGRIEVHTLRPDGKELDSHWLRFEKVVNVADEDGKEKDCRIAIAYSLTNLTKDNEPPAWKVTPLERGQVSIFFPAEKETSNLRFHIHAPFASTVARDSVRNCEANKALRDHLAQLAAESLTIILDQGLLTVGFLAALPNQSDNLPPFYEPIRLAIVKEFKRNPLVPARAGDHAAADDLIRCPAKLVKELSDNDISLIAGKSLRVAANPSQLNQREDQFLKSLWISDWGWKELNIAISSKSQLAAIEDWLLKKNNESLTAFYKLLNHSKEQVNNLNVANVRIVGAGSIMCIPNGAFFPLDDASRPDDIHFVESAFCSGDSRAFLESIGVQPYDEKATIRRVLESYKSPSEPGTDHVGHIKKFISFLKKNPSEENMFHSRSFLLGNTPSDGSVLCQPSKLYLDMPYSETLLSTYYEKLPEDKRTQYLLASTYQDEGINREELADFARAVGVRVALDVKPLKSIQKNPDRASLTSGGVDRKNNDKYHRDERDFDIQEFQALLGYTDLSVSRLIWKTMCESVKKEHLRAIYRRNNHSDEKSANSQLVHRLRVANWVPQANGRFVKPSEARSIELPAGFSFDPGQEWLKAIGFGDDEKKHSEEYQTQDRIARNMGLSSGNELTAYLDAIKESGLTPEQIRAAGAQRKHISQPEASVKDPEKRRRGVREGGDSAPSKEGVIREQSIQPEVPEVTAAAKAYLRTLYKNPDGQLVCQCCHDEMPFKLRSGDHYFEAVQCVRDQDTHDFQNRLALCPTCAAMYQYAREIDDAEIRRRIIEHTADDKVPAVEIPAHLAGHDYTMRFVGTHWFDLKTVLSRK